MTVSQDQADNTTTATKIKNPLSFFGNRGVGDKDRIHRETVPVSVLSADKPTGKETVIGYFVSNRRGGGHGVMAGLLNFTAAQNWQRRGICGREGSLW